MGCLFALSGVFLTREAFKLKNLLLELVEFEGEFLSAFSHLLFVSAFLVYQLLPRLRLSLALFFQVFRRQLDSLFCRATTLNADTHASQRGGLFLSLCLFVREKFAFL